MHERILYASALVLIGIALIIGVASAEERQITDAPVDQRYASVIGDRILWSDNRTGDYGVYLYNATEDRERPLSPLGANHTIPEASAGMAMSRDHIVWQDDRNGGWDIYLYDLSTGQETRITNGAGDAINPAIAGDWIVWQDDRNGNWDIYLHDLSTGKELQITRNESSQVTPAVTGTMVVWNDLRSGSWDIYAWIPEGAPPPAETVTPVTAVTTPPATATTPGHHDPHHPHLP